jgi:hypothetical protein
MDVGGNFGNMQLENKNCELWNPKLKNILVEACIQTLEAFRSKVVHPWTWRAFAFAGNQHLPHPISI